MFDLTGKNALVTGASGGIGAAVARALHAAGATVGLSGTRVEPLQALAAELGSRAHVLPCDLSNAAAVEDLVKQAVEAMGSVDILVNNAGITRDGLAMRMSDEDWLSVIEVNLTSTFRLCRAAIRPMMKARWGRIINVTSVVAQAGNPGQVNYAAAKSGIHGFTKSLAAEGARHGVTANAIAPGYIGTEMLSTIPDNVMEKIVAQIPVGRLGQPEEIARGVEFLTSDNAGFITGSTLSINGGQHMY